MRLAPLLLLAGWLASCGERPQPPPEEDPVARLAASGVQVDTVGVLNLAEGDTLNLDRGLTIVETTISFPREAEDGEVFAWEFYAQELQPVKLIIVRFDQKRDNLELVGESEMVVPRQKGPNRFLLREPIPVKYRDLFGLIQPEEGAIPFRKVFNWHTLITVKPFTRPLMQRELFSMYGWRYAVRVFWRKAGSG